VPHTPNPASGFVHYVQRKDILYLDWPIEDGLKVIVSGGVVQPDLERLNATRAARGIEPAAEPAPPPFSPEPAPEPPGAKGPATAAGAAEG